MKINMKHWMRVIHRDLGFLMVGITVVYALSGFLLNHMNGKDPAYEQIAEQLVVTKQMNRSQLEAFWNADDSYPSLRKTTQIDDEMIRLYLQGGIGVYNGKTGELEYQTSNKRPLIFWINKLHYNKLNGWSWMGDFFAFSLIFLAISGIWMVPGKRGIKGRGKWYILIGILIPIIYVILNI
ncbi:PepSY-associated TM helix domain-containing protein [Halosquirtibacter xylanolyticus]|uniref:PepSY-associated TM helix domain-containing protein n=1 Tax=Halosquirtibacter xylanolyticus TaxID=3374599 RepID=UPI003747E994|nr:PepSY-associated TM helix domain-containing protein [Prolixibacteraceae bacterium]